MLSLTKTIENGEAWYETEHRGVVYSLRFATSFGYWELWSKRQRYSGMPSIRQFDSLGALEKDIKAFKGVSALLSAEQSPEKDGLPSLAH